MRESRYFTALKAYKHGARGRKSRCRWSKRPRSAGSPGSLSRSPEHGSGSTESRSGSTGVGARGAGAREWSLGSAASALLHRIAAPRPQLTEPAEPGTSRCSAPHCAGRASAPWGLRTEVTAPPYASLPASLPAFLPASSHRIPALLPNPPRSTTLSPLAGRWVDAAKRVRACILAAGGDSRKRL